MSSTKTTTDHEEIRRWAEERGGRPAAVVGPMKHKIAGGLRIDFPGFDSDEELEEITWAEFFDKFEEQNLVFMYQEEMVC
ncbi:MAG TPA: hypothetical protein VGG03_09375 [Thermoanaerobaculia bacterium]|jgi:hypothetical protein